MKLKFIVFVVGLLALLGFVSNEIVNSDTTEFTLLTTGTSFVAGKPIQIQFSSNAKANQCQLLIMHSYGKTIVEPMLTDAAVVFELPEMYTHKTGVLSWILIHESKQIMKGSIEILPNNQTKTQIENYIGPPSIVAGNTQFSMLVSIPTDSFDNPKSDSTLVDIKHQFLDEITNKIEYSKDFICWERIYAPTKSGKVIVTSTCEKTSIKENEIIIYPSIARSFTIDYNRNHDFADGNQVTTLTTSIIVDQFGNTVSDGTLICFQIKNSQGLLLKTYGTTIAGQAKAQMIHPDKADTYEVIGYVSGIAQSNTISITYKTIVDYIVFSFGNNNRKLVVGPIKSFMGQLIPDGNKVAVKIYRNGTCLETMVKETSKGKAMFVFSPEYYESDNYVFEIKTLGIQHQIEKKLYE
jgi:hypothetical protein